MVVANQALHEDTKVRGPGVEASCKPPQHRTSDVTLRLLPMYPVLFGTNFLRSSGSASAQRNDADRIFHTYIISEMVVHMPHVIGTKMYIASYPIQPSYSLVAEV